MILNHPGFQDLIKDLHSELSGDFRKLVMAMLKTPTEFDASELNSSIKVNTAAILQKMHVGVSHHNEGLNACSLKRHTQAAAIQTKRFS